MSNSVSLMKRAAERVQFNEYYIVALIIAASLAFRLFYAWKPVDWLIDKGISDDAFYYFQIARNIAQGNGVSFDGLSPTNGFHPLYMVILVPMFLLVPSNPDLSVNLALTMVISISALTALPIYQLVKKVIGKYAAFIALMAWLFNPWVYMITLTAVESAFYVFFVSLVSLVYVHYQNEGDLKSSKKWPVILGLLLGVTVLGRTDGAFLFIAIMVDMLLVLGNRSKSLQGNLSSEKIIHIILITLVCGLVLLPWVGWNFITFHSVLQVSGASVLRTNHFGFTTNAFSMLSPIIKSSIHSLVNIAMLTFQVVILGVLILIFSKIPRYNRYAEDPPKHPSILRRPLRFLLIYSIFWFIFYSWVFWGRQAWYYMPVLFVAAILAGVLYYYFRYSIKLSSLGSKSIWVAALFLVGTFIVGILLWQNESFRIYPLQRNGYQLAQWLSEGIEEDARIGAWDSGILGYYANRTVINLDGVVNNNLYEYAVDRDISVYDVKGLYDFLHENQIDYITDYEDIFSEYYQSSNYDNFLELIHEFPSVNGEYNVRIFRIAN